jgi:hypothetical protein
MSRTKAPSLAETMRNVARPSSPASLTERPIGFYASTRAGKKKLTVALNHAAHRQFRLLALELDRNGEDLLLEAINDLFEKNSKTRIA